jgi:hypothetical protein
MKKTACFVLVFAASVGVCGCGRSLSPELRGSALSKAEAHDNQRVNNNQYGRMLSDDLARLFLADNPVRLSPYPIVSTGGMPRN